jgi:glutaconate CoA-transferase subunit A
MNKVISLKEAVKKYIKPNQKIYISGFAYQESFAFVYEMIRQNKKNLFIIKTSGGLLVDMLIGAKCVKKLLVSHVWNSVGPVPAYNFRRVIEGKLNYKIELEELSFGVLTLAFFAGATGLPFIPTTPVQGTGHFTYRTFLGEDKFKLIKNPFGKEKVCVVKPIKPDIGIIHVQRADENGNSQILGPLAELKYASNACNKLIVTTEEIVSKKLIKKEPEKTVILGDYVEAVIKVPFGGHPSDVYKYYHRDIDFYKFYGEISRTEDGFKKFLNEWIINVKDHKQYLKKLGEKRIKKISWMS